MALTFGKHKGKSIMEVFDYDYNYLEWCFENIPNFMSKLDQEDKENLRKLAHPIEYINNKYKIDFKNTDFDDKLAPILRSEGFLMTLMEIGVMRMDVFIMK